MSRGYIFAKRFEGNRQRLTEQRTALERDPTSRLEPIIRFVNASKQAAILATGCSLEEKRDHFKKTGSNLQLLNRELRWIPRDAWQIVHETLADQGCFAHNDEAACGAQAASSCGETSLNLAFPLKWS